MSSRKTTVFYAGLIAVASLAVGMVIASRLDLSPRSEAQPLNLTPQVSTAGPAAGPLDTLTFRNIAKAQTPAVVNIRTQSKRPAQDISDFFGGGQSDPFGQFFRNPQQQPRNQRPREEVAVAAGTGFIINKDGYILTNNHVVEGATKIEVGLYGDEDQVYEAKIVGHDQLTDSALIQLIRKPDHALPEAKLGDSSQMAPGDWVMAIGNPFNLSHTISVGVISAIGRPMQVAEQRWEDVLQTDAAINPGNSGGPLLNVKGEVIGVNTAIYTDSARAANIGIGFAVPINAVRDILPQLQTGKIVRGKIGVSVRDVSRDALADFGLKERKGAVVASVTPNGPAAKGGIELGDVILEVNGKTVGNRNELVRMIMATKPGTSVPIKVLRDKREKSLSVTVEELDLAAEGNQSEQTAQEEETGGGFGLTLGPLSSDMARRLRVPSGTKGVLISDMDPTGAAAQAGLQPGDIIVRINRQPVETIAEASRALTAIKPGSTAFLIILRGGQEQFITMTKK
jgi:serine protease Do